MRRSYRTIFRYTGRFFGRGAPARHSWVSRCTGNFHSPKRVSLFTAD